MDKEVFYRYMIQPFPNSDPLLPAAHPHPVKLRPIKELAENKRNLLFNDPRPVVLDGDFIAVLAGEFDMHPNFRQNPRLFASVKRVVHRLFDRGKKGFPQVIEPQKVSVLSEKLADRNLLLSSRHRFGVATAFVREQGVGHRTGQRT